MELREHERGALLVGKLARGDGDRLTELAALESRGLLDHPHTSAGRVPTDAGYRLFVDEVARIKPLSAPERAAITALLSGAVDLEQVVARTVRALAQLTGAAAPTLRC